MRGGTKMKFSITFRTDDVRTDDDIKYRCEHLRIACRSNDYCPVGMLPCPFISKKCRKVKADDWAKIIKEVKE